MRKKNTESLREILQQVLKSNHLDKQLNEKHLIEAWPKILGENITKYSTNLVVKNRVLYVSISSSVLRHDLFLSREKIKDSLNREVGVELIKEIIFR